MTSVVLRGGTRSLGNYWHPMLSCSDLRPDSVVDLWFREANTCHWSLFVCASVCACLISLCIYFWCVFRFRGFDRWQTKLCRAGKQKWPRGVIIWNDVDSLDSGQAIRHYLPSQLCRVVSKTPVAQNSITLFFYSCQQ